MNRAELPDEVVIQNSLRRVLLACLSGAMFGCVGYSPCDEAQYDGAGTPDNACRVDGCTLAPDYDFEHCCNAHDVTYWIGGDYQDRLRADKAMRQCIRDSGHENLAALYYTGVRIGGMAILPTPWRWGFGWDYPKHAPPTDDVDDSTE